MKLSARARYAVRLLLEVFRMGGMEKPVQLSRIAEKSGISRRFLEQVALALRASSLIRGVSGRKGGYLLAKPPSEITMREIVASASGPIRLAECVDHPTACSRSDRCACRTLWCLMQRRLNDILGEITLDLLADTDIMDNMRKQLGEVPTSPHPDEMADGQAPPCGVISGMPACATAGECEGLEGEAEEIGSG
ncbi:MAG: Rrf2 family transcriptional regulator [Pseudomonadota bacterium]